MGGRFLALLASLVLWIATPVAAQGKLAALPALKPVAACASLATADLDKATGAHTIITSAADIADARPYCKITGTIEPQVKFEVRLPVQGWTQRYLQTGCGGLCGGVSIRIDKPEGCSPVTDGTIALATTNMGHEGMNMAWGDNPQQREDFAHRGVHVTALAAKALIAKFYGQGPRYAYFAGCSDGGREALIEAQRHAGDFDGIVAGAPALHFSVQNSIHHGWMATSNTGADGKPILTGIDMTPLHLAALKACDAIDGLKDGQIDDPRRCKFDPALALCTGASVPGQCLTAIQVAAARKLYDGAHDASGRKLVAGSVQPGSELEWAGVFVPRQVGGTIFSEKIALDSINGLMFTPNPAPPMKLGDLKFTKATLASLEPARKFYDADNADLAPFAAHGGKLILWHGWSDPHISPINTIGYFDKVGKAMGTKKRDAFVRLFMFPAMGHCAGGDGPNEFPMLNAIMAWVESGIAPDQLVAHHADRRSRPVFAYPRVARYTGKGSVDQAGNFAPVMPQR